MQLDPLQHAISQEGWTKRMHACADQTPVRVGVIANPRARRLQRAGQRRLLESLAGPRLYEETRDLASLRRALAHLVTDAGVNVLAVAGGDGSLHHTVNALWQIGQETMELHGVLPPMPRILILNGGTLNIVGRSVAIHGPPAETLRQFLQSFRDQPLSRIPVRPMPLLEVAWQGQTPRLGFIFGSAAAYHALELYGRFGAGYWGLTRFLSTFAHGALWGNEMWRRESWKLGPYADLQVDDRHFSTYTGVVAATADLTLAIGAIRAIRRPLGAEGFAVRVVGETEPRRLAKLLPALMSTKQTQGIVDIPFAQHLHLSGPCTLDGEIFEAPTPHLPLHVYRHAQLLAVVPANAFGAAK